MQASAALNAVIRTLYPPQCLVCETHVDTEYALCGGCWPSTPFIEGLVCDFCGAPLPGQEDGPTLGLRCDDCLRHPPPWHQGRAVFLYEGHAKHMILQLKHADRLDLARPFGAWMLRIAQPLLEPDMIVAPIPLHWWRLLRRRANQSALLSARIASGARLTHIPDLLRRTRATGSQEGRGRSARIANLQGAIAPHRRHASKVEGRSVLLVDDVMTSGATLSAATEALLDAGAARVKVIVLARVSAQQML